MHIWVGPGNECWLVCLIDPDQESWSASQVLKSFPTKDAALAYAYKLTSLKVAVGDPNRRLSDVK